MNSSVCEAFPGSCAVQQLLFRSNFLAAHGEMREFQQDREGSERSVLLHGHGQKYPGITGGGEGEYAQ